jgi:hypothetical protein
MSREDGQTQDRLRNDAAVAAGSTIGINGSRGGGLRFGSIGSDGKKRGEEIHCCVCGAWVGRRYRRRYETLMKQSEDERLVHALLLYLVSLG